MDDIAKEASDAFNRVVDALAMRGMDLGGLGNSLKASGVTSSENLSAAAPLPATGRERSGGHER